MTLIGVSGFPTRTGAAGDCGVVSWALEVSGVIVKVGDFTDLREPSVAVSV